MTNSQTHRTRNPMSASWRGRLISALTIAAMVGGCSPKGEPGNEEAAPHPAGIPAETPAGTPAEGPAEDPAGPAEDPAEPLKAASMDQGRGEAPAPEGPQLRDLDLLVLMPGGEPANVVSVRLLDTALVSTADILRATGGEPDAEKLLEVLGQGKLTDSRGRVTFETSGGPLLASASLGHLFVMQQFPPPAEDEEMLTLQLAIDASVRARAVGPDGSRISGVPIALTMELPTPDKGNRSRWIDLAVRETSGDDATVRFPDPRGGVQPPGGDRKPRFGLRAAIPGLDDPTPLFFDPEAPPDAPIDVPVPPLSTFVVEALSADGHLLDIEAEVFIEEQNAGSGPGSDSGSGSKLRTSLRGGRATFTTVVPGTLLRVTIQPLDGGAAFEGVGPSALLAGDVQTISVSMESTSREKRR